jgi:hypothetical protein
MPYLHWEVEEKLCEMKTFIREVEKDGKDFRKSGNFPQGYDRDKILLGAYLNGDEEIPHPLHIRRTLSQYYYNTLKDTNIQGEDQVVSRYLRKYEAKTDVVVMMVDQLWLWILGGNNILPTLDS